MKKIILFILILAFLGCGKEQKEIHGIGVVDDISTIDFSGKVLRDSNDGELYDLSSETFSAVDSGSIVAFEGKPSTGPRPAGVPLRIEFTKFDIIGIEN